MQAEGTTALTAALTIGCLTSITPQGAPAVLPIGRKVFASLRSHWVAAFGPLARRIGTIAKIAIEDASEIWTPPYDKGVTKDRMITPCRSKYEAMFP